MAAARGMPSLHLTSMFGVRLGADGRVMYGVEYEDASGNGGRMLQWQPVLAWSDGATISAGLTEPTLLSRFLASLCDHSSFLHPCQADARERARRWGEAVVAECVRDGAHTAQHCAPEFGGCDAGRRRRP